MNIKRLWNIKKLNFGQGTLEFALILPIFLLIIFGIIDFGRLAYYNLIINDYNREVSRMISIGTSLNNVKTNISNTVKPLTGIATVTVTDDTDSNGDVCTKITLVPSSGYPVSYQITPAYTNTLRAGTIMRGYLEYHINFLTPLEGFIKNNIKVKSVIYIRLEGTPTQ